MLQVTVLTGIGDFSRRLSMQGAVLLVYKMLHVAGVHAHGPAHHSQ